MLFSNSFARCTNLSKTRFGWKEYTVLFFEMCLSNISKLSDFPYKCSGAVKLQ